MGECDYWLCSDGAQWCDLINDACDCGGSDEHCRIGGRSIGDVIRLEEKVTLDEAALRAQKRRHGLRKAC